MRILIIEDERHLATLLRRSLTEEGYAVDLACDGGQGELYALSIPYDLIILDIVLPIKDGFEICTNLRKKGIATRVLMLTARDSITDKVRGLDGGADDYLVKPFDFNELSARIRTLLRRPNKNQPSVVTAGEISIDTLSHHVKRGNEVIPLTNKEFSILEYFFLNPDLLITRRMIEVHCWNLTLDSESNLIEAYVLRLRKKFDEPGKPSIIETVRGAGYRLNLK